MPKACIVRWKAGSNRWTQPFTGLRSRAEMNRSRGVISSLPAVREVMPMSRANDRFPST